MLTTGQEYATPLLLAHGNVDPVILEGVVGFEVTTVIALHAVELLPHEFDAYTQIFPLTAVLPKLMLTEVVPCPEEMVAPVGAVQM